MIKNNLICVCAISLISLAVISCGGKKAETTEQEEVNQTTESMANSSGSSDASDTKSIEEDKKEIEIKNFDFSTITESNATIGEFPYLKDIPGFKVMDRDVKETDFDRVVVYDGNTFSSIEGRLLYKEGTTEDEKTFSSYKTIKQFENACEKLNAAKIYSISGDEYRTALFGGDSGLMSLCPQKEKPYLVKYGSKETALYALKKGDKKILFYLTLDGKYGGMYDLYIVEESKLEDN